MTDSTSLQIENQEFALRLGAIYLTQQLLREHDVQLKEAVFSSLCAFLIGKNLEGKRLFIKEYNGMSLLKKLIFENLTRTFL